jgi:MSHA pilin protein MshB
MTNQRGWSRFEWLITVSAIGIVLLFAVTRYLDMAREGRRMGFELLAHHFTAAVAMTRAHWLINRAASNEFFIEINGQGIYMSEEGWPASASPVLIGREAETQLEKSPAACQELWQTLLQNPEPATLEGQSSWGQRRYHISRINEHVCRYELVTKERGSHFFDYDVRTGQVMVTTPPYKEISSL